MKTCPFNGHKSCDANCALWTHNSDGDTCAITQIAVQLSNIALKEK